MSGYWWCPRCKDPVDGNQVTYEECHELCGHTVQWITPAEKTRMQELEVENFKLRATIAERDTQLDLAEKLIGEEWAGGGDWQWCRCCDARFDAGHKLGCLRAKWFRGMEAYARGH